MVDLPRARRPVARPRVIRREHGDSLSLSDEERRPAFVNPSHRNARVCDGYPIPIAESPGLRRLDVVPAVEATRRRTEEFVPVGDAPTLP